MYTMVCIFHYFFKGKQLLWLSVCFSGQQSSFRWDLLLKGKQLRRRESKFVFFIRMTPIEKEGKNESGRVAFPKGVPIHLNYVI